MCFEGGNAQPPCPRSSSDSLWNAPWTTAAPAVGRKVFHFLILNSPKSPLWGIGEWGKRRRRRGWQREEKWRRRHKVLDGGDGKFGVCATIFNSGRSATDEQHLEKGMECSGGTTLGDACDSTKRGHVLRNIVGTHNLHHTSQSGGRNTALHPEHDITGCAQASKCGLEQSLRVQTLKERFYSYR